jgi:hypothetical protein
MLISLPFSVAFCSNPSIHSFIYHSTLQGPSNQSRRQIKIKIKMKIKSESES